MSKRTRKVTTDLTKLGIGGPPKSPQEALEELGEVEKKLFGGQQHAVLTEDGEVMPCDFLTWAYFLERGRVQRVLVQEDLPGGYWISTLFLGLNHRYVTGPPLWFETMIFAPSDGKPCPVTGKVHRLGPEVFCDRYTTLKEALAGHESAKTAWLEKRNAARGF